MQDAASFRACAERCLRLANAISDPRTALLIEMRPRDDITCKT